ncbi:YbiU family protein [Rhodoferax sp.]|uniref:YbiU family protein n=1 Tax=Rhodoferax sp. TaxID=50421 RepID=UPI00374DB5F9
MQQADPNLNFQSQIIAAKRQLRAQIPDLKERFDALTRNIEAQVEAIERERAQGLQPVPDVQFSQLDTLDAAQIARIKQRGCVVIRGVFDPARVAQWNTDLASYISDNHYLDKQVSKRGIDKYFSALASSKPQIYGIYWSKPQMDARQSVELAQTRRWLNRLWDSQHEGQPVFNPDQECTYSDRVRQREPGDASLGLSPHMDGGSIERWIDPGYQNVFRHVFGGDISQYDPFAAAYRTETHEIPSPAVCSMFRTFQGWTALTPQGPGDGTLNLVPIANAMAWMLLRALQDDIAEDQLCGARAGRALVASPEHHALLLRAYGPIPKVNAGDTVWWHPDTIHGVEDKHQGSGYSNVIYIGAAPDCAKNQAFLAKQRPAFEAGKSSPDFAPEDYEVDFEGRFTPEDLTPLGRSQMGYGS